MISTVHAQPYDGPFTLPRERDLPCVHQDVDIQHFVRLTRYLDPIKPAKRVINPNQEACVM